MAEKDYFGKTMEVMYRNKWRPCKVGAPIKSKEYEITISSLKVVTYVAYADASRLLRKPNKKGKLKDDFITYDVLLKRLMVIANHLRKLDNDMCDEEDTISDGFMKKLESVVKAYEKETKGRKRLPPLYS